MNELGPQAGIANITDRAIPNAQRLAGYAVAALLLLATVAVLPYRTAPHGEVPAFIPVCVTVWTVADLLTAYLLLSQFAVTGIYAYLVIAGAYGFGGLLSIPYLLRFPDVFVHGLSVADQQYSVALWSAWHVVFALTMIGWFTLDPTFGRRCAGSTRTPLLLGLGAVSILALGTAGVFFALRGALPVLIVNGHFQTAFSQIVTPAIVVLNLIAVAAILVRARPATSLQVWLAIAVLAAALDALLNSASLARYSLTWYFGKLETVVASSIVLVMLLAEVTMLYRRLAGMAMFDALTGLRNRRGFDEAFEWAADFSRRHGKTCALLVIDVDYFKQFNDRYGHAMGDTALRLVADTLLQSLMRSTDVVARYGGEEFVVVISDAGEQTLEFLAERVRASIERLGVRHEASAIAPVLTVSVGAALMNADGRRDLRELFNRADDALYAAKTQGRNRWVVAAPVPGEAFDAVASKLLSP